MRKRAGAGERGGHRPLRQIARVLLSLGLFYIRDADRVPTIRELGTGSYRWGRFPRIYRKQENIVTARSLDKAVGVLKFYYIL